MDNPPSTHNRFATFCNSVLLLSLLCLAPMTYADDNDLVIITHPSNTIQSLKFNTLRAIYSMRMQTWPDGKPVKVFILSDTHSTHKDFCKDTLRTIPRYLRKNWDRQVFSGIAQAPRVVESLERMKQVIAITPGAIGYILREDVDETVSIITINN